MRQTCYVVIAAPPEPYSPELVSMAFARFANAYKRALRMESAGFTVTIVNPAAPAPQSPASSAGSVQR